MINLHDEFLKWTTGWWDRLLLRTGWTCYPKYGCRNILDYGENKDRIGRNELVIIYSRMYYEGPRAIEGIPDQSKVFVDISDQSGKLETIARNSTFNRLGRGFLFNTLAVLRPGDRLDFVEIRNGYYTPSIGIFPPEDDPRPFLVGFDSPRIPRRTSLKELLSKVKELIPDLSLPDLGPQPVPVPVPVRSYGRRYP